jgi:hypothetical protein
MAVLPTGNVITVTSTATLSGNKSFQLVMKFVDRSSSPSSQSLTGTLADIGNIKLDLDTQEDAKELNDFVYNCAEFNFSMFSTFGDGSSFGSMLSKLQVTDLIQVEITYDGNNKDVFLCLKTDVSYDEIKRMFSVKCFSVFKFSNQVTAYNVPSGDIISLSYNDGTIYNYSGITFRDLLKNYLNTISANTSTNVVESAFTNVANDANFADPTETDYKYFHMFVQNENSLTLPQSIIGTGNKFKATTFEEARSAVLRVGIVECAIIGSLFGKNFYVRRDSANTSYRSQLDASDLEELKIKFQNNNISIIKILASTIDQPLSFSQDVSATKKIDINVGLFVNSQQLDGDQSPVIVTDPQGAYSESDAELDLGDKMYKAYKALLGTPDSTITGNTGSIKFSMTILGTEKLKPYEYIELNENSSEFVLADSGSIKGNNKIRPSMLEYDLKNNKIKVEGYSINQLQ